MTLNDLERQNGGFCGFFWRFWAAIQVYIIHKVAPRYYRYAIQIENLYLYILTECEHPCFQLNY